MRALALVVGLLAASCQSGGVPVTDAFMDFPPRSILVLPPLDESIETGATYGTLASMTRPLAEAGYYVFPVAVVTALMRENGLPTPYEMHEVPLEKLREIFDPDAVLYATVTDWGTSYQILNSSTRITVSARLVSAETGAEIWSGRQTVVQNSNNGGGSLVGMLAGALVNQVASSVADPSRDIARSVNWQLLRGQRNGWLLGPYHPDAQAELQTLLTAREEAAATAR